MSSPDAIPSRGDVVVVPDYLRDMPNPAFAPNRLGGRPLTDDLDATEARR
ncbi:MAG TPA: hypothetical protein VK501_22825 [Baekduia sp.]|nr:hypothetical protein [Baekduia sp.]HMJ36756.1 hypothetical protein [Baekduia sp.]